jgi:putative membrane protein
MALIDLLIDPVAINPMKLWIWIDNGWYYGIPIINFFGWFFVSIVIFSFLHQKPAWNVWHLYIGTSIILFFTIIAFAEKLFLAGIAGILVVVLQIVVEFQLNVLSIFHAQHKKKEIK